MTQTQQIHQDFRQAIDVSTYKKPQEVSISEEMLFLASIGARQSSTFKRHEQLSGIKEKLSEEREVASALTKLEARFPKYRLISLSAVMTLADKYGLKIGMFKNYTGEVPQDNIQELKAYQNTVDASTSACYETIEKMFAQDESYNGRNRRNQFLIVAPKQYFDKSVSEVAGFMIPLPKVKAKFMDFSKAFDFSAILTDPIILCPLTGIPGTEVWAHIATAWDLEAEDPMVKKEIDIIASFS